MDLRSLVVPGREESQKRCPFGHFVNGHEIDRTSVRTVDSEGINLPTVTPPDSFGETGSTWGVHAHGGKGDGTFHKPARFALHAHQCAVVVLVDEIDSAGIPKGQEHPFSTIHQGPRYLSDRKLAQFALVHGFLLGKEKPSFLLNINVADTPFAVNSSTPWIAGIVRKTALDSLAFSRQNAFGPPSLLGGVRLRGETALPVGNGLEFARRASNLLPHTDRNEL
jgi:hypothetical protein